MIVQIHDFTVEWNFFASIEFAFQKLTL